ncbi:hypothetical protein SNEBB_002426 [Seison nebaliae]|nr:hypothetical protein SNEBB_002426 [Seison nebaliae]
MKRFQIYLFCCFVILFRCLNGQQTNESGKREVRLLDDDFVLNKLNNNPPQAKVKGRKRKRIVKQPKLKIIPVDKVKTTTPNVPKKVRVRKELYEKQNIVKTYNPKAKGNASPQEEAVMKKGRKRKIIPVHKVTTTTPHVPKKVRVRKDLYEEQNILKTYHPKAKGNASPQEEAVMKKGPKRKIIPVHKVTTTTPNVPKNVPLHKDLSEEQDVVERPAPKVNPLNFDPIDLPEYQSENEFDFNAKKFPGEQDVVEGPDPQLNDNASAQEDAVMENGPKSKIIPVDEVTTTSPNVPKNVPVHKDLSEEQDVVERPAPKVNRVNFDPNDLPDFQSEDEDDFHEEDEFGFDAEEDMLPPCIRAELELIMKDIPDEEVVVDLNTMIKVFIKSENEELSKLTTPMHLPIHQCWQAYHRKVGKLQIQHANYIKLKYNQRNFFAVQLANYVREDQHLNIVLEEVANIGDGNVTRRITDARRPMEFFGHVPKSLNPSKYHMYIKHPYIRNLRKKVEALSLVEPFRPLSKRNTVIHLKTPLCRWMSLGAMEVMRFLRIKDKSLPCQYVPPIQIDNVFMRRMTPLEENNGFLFMPPPLTKQYVRSFERFRLSGRRTIDRFYNLYSWVTHTRLWGTCEFRHFFFFRAEKEYNDKNHLPTMLKHLGNMHSDTALVRFTLYLMSRYFMGEAYLGDKQQDSGENYDIFYVTPFQCRQIKAEDIDPDITPHEYKTVALTRISTTLGNILASRDIVTIFNPGFSYTKCYVFPSSKNKVSLKPKHSHQQYYNVTKVMKYQVEDYSRNLRGNNVNLLSERKADPDEINSQYDFYGNSICHEKVSPLKLNSGKVVCFGLLGGFSLLMLATPLVLLMIISNSGNEHNLPSFDYSKAVKQVVIKNFTTFEECATQKRLFGNGSMKNVCRLLTDLSTCLPMDHHPLERFQLRIFYSSATCDSERFFLSLRKYFEKKYLLNGLEIIEVGNKLFSSIVNIRKEDIGLLKTLSTEHFAVGATAIPTVYVVKEIGKSSKYPFDISLSREISNIIEEFHITDLTNYYRNENDRQFVSNTIAMLKVEGALKTEKDCTDKYMRKIREKFLKFFQIENILLYCFMIDGEMVFRLYIVQDVTLNIPYDLFVFMHRQDESFFDWKRIISVMIGLYKSNFTSKIYKRRFFSDKHLPGGKKATMMTTIKTQKVSFVYTGDPNIRMKKVRKFGNGKFGRLSVQMDNYQHCQQLHPYFAKSNAQYYVSLPMKYDNTLNIITQITICTANVKIATDFVTHLTQANLCPATNVRDVGINFTEE